MIVCLSASDLMNVYINNVPFKSRDDIKTSFFFFLRQTENVGGPESEKENKNWKNTVFGPPTTTSKFQG